MIYNVAILVGILGLLSRLGEAKVYFKVSGN
jgi:hypothetical protein